LAKLKIVVSPATVRRLLRQLNYRLHANAKSLSVNCPEREEHFIYMAEEKNNSSNAACPSSAWIPKRKN
jgi:hypothetical protein